MAPPRTRLIFALVIVATLGPQAAAWQERPWPKQTAQAIFVSRPTSSLPEALRAALLNRDEFTRGSDTLPGSLWVARLDLDGKRGDEFIVRSPESYSGGPMMYVFERQKDAYVAIADFQGTVYFGARHNGYLEIVSQSRGGAGMYTRTLHRYERNRYQPVRMADYQLKADGETLEFVRERSPAQFRRPPK